MTPHGESLRIVSLGLLLMLACSGGVAPSERQATVNAVIEVAAQTDCSGQTSDSPDTREHCELPDFFSVLHHLTMEEGYVLGCVHHRVRLGARPVLYARPKDRPPLRSYDEFVEALGSGDESLRSEYAGIDRSRTDVTRRSGHIWQRWLTSVRTDGSEDGFFELALLRVLGGQFCLVWHTNYDDLLPLCDRTGVEALLKEKHFDRRLPRGVREAARQLDVEPTVALSADAAVVSIVVFTKWGGFLKRTITFSRDFPHTILDETEETLVEYECNVLF